MILIDTDVCIELLWGDECVIEQRIRCDEQVAICFISVGELFYGAHRSQYPDENLTLVEEFIMSVDIIHTDFEIMQKFGELKSGLYNQNTLLPDADILIASTALTKCSKLITGNIKHFRRFETLSLENWIQG